MRRRRQTPTVGVKGVGITYLLVWALLTACDRSPHAGRGSSLSSRGVLIAVVGPSEGHPQWPGIRGGVQRFLAGAPLMRCVCVAPPESTSDSLHATVRRVLEQRPSVVCLHVTDADTARLSIDSIVAARALLLTMGARCEDVRIAGHIGVDLTGAAEQLGNSLERIAAGRQTYLLVHESGRTPLATKCYQRFSAAARRQYHITLLQGENAAQGERSHARLVEEMLGRFPNAALVVTLNPDVWLAARAGWNRELRKLNSGFRFATLAAAPVLWHRLGTPAAPGEAAALVGPLDGEIGFTAVEVATQLLLSTQKTSYNRTIPCELVTPENLEDFAQRYSAAANGLDGAKFLPTAPAPSDPPGD